MTPEQIKLQQYQIATFVKSMREHIISNGTARQLADFDSKFTNVDFSSVREIAEAEQVCRMAELMKKDRDVEVSSSNIFLVVVAILAVMFFTCYGLLDVLMGGKVYEYCNQFFNFLVS